MQNCVFQEGGDHFDDSFKEMQRRLVSVRVDLIKMNICHCRRNHEKCCRLQERTAVVYVGKPY